MWPLKPCNISFLLLHALSLVNVVDLVSSDFCLSSSSFLSAFFHRVSNSSGQVLMLYVTIHNAHDSTSLHPCPTHLSVQPSQLLINHQNLPLSNFFNMLLCILGSQEHIFFGTFCIPIYKFIHAPYSINSHTPNSFTAFRQIQF